MAVARPVRKGVTTRSFASELRRALTIPRFEGSLVREPASGGALGTFLAPSCEGRQARIPSQPADFATNAHARGAWRAQRPESAETAPNLRLATVSGAIDADPWQFRPFRPPSAPVVSGSRPARADPASRPPSAPGMSVSRLSRHDGSDDATNAHARVARQARVPSSPRICDYRPPDER